MTTLVLYMTACIFWNINISYLFPAPLSWSEELIQAGVNTFHSVTGEVGHGQEERWIGMWTIRNAQIEVGPWIQLLSRCSERSRRKGRHRGRLTSLQYFVPSPTVSKCHGHTDFAQTFQICTCKLEIHVFHSIFLFVSLYFVLLRCTFGVFSAIARTHFLNWNFDRAKTRTFRMPASSSSSPGHISLSQEHLQTVTLNPGQIMDTSPTSQPIRMSSGSYQ